jgi:hypothetical protein
MVSAQRRWIVPGSTDACREVFCPSSPSRVRSTSRVAWMSAPAERHVQRVPDRQQRFALPRSHAGSLHSGTRPAIPRTSIPQIPIGTIQSLEHVLRHLDQLSDSSQPELATLTQTMEDYRAQANRPFEHEARIVPSSHARPRSMQLWISQRATNRPLVSRRPPMQPYNSPKTPAPPQPKPRRKIPARRSGSALSVERFGGCRMLGRQVFEANAPSLVKTHGLRVDPCSSRDRRTWR